LTLKGVKTLTLNNHLGDESSKVDLKHMKDVDYLEKLTKSFIQESSTSGRDEKKQRGVM